MASGEVNLSVNGVPVEVNDFVRGFIDNVVVGMVAALEGVGEIQNVALSFKGDAVQISVNNAPVAVNPFVTKIIGNTVKGMISPLKGVSEIDGLNIAIKR